MTKAELLDIAAAMGIDNLNSGDLKADIIAAIIDMQEGL